MSDQKNLNCLWTRHNNRVYDIDGVPVLRVSDLNTVVAERVVAEHNAFLGIADIEGFMKDIKHFVAQSNGCECHICRAVFLKFMFPKNTRQDDEWDRLRPANETPPKDES